jgi:hypothetical protein
MLHRIALVYFTFVSVEVTMMTQSVSGLSSLMTRYINLEDRVWGSGCSVGRRKLLDDEHTNLKHGFHGPGIQKLRVKRAGDERGGRWGGEGGCVNLRSFSSLSRRKSFVMGKKMLSVDSLELKRKSGEWSGFRV